MADERGSRRCRWPGPEPAPSLEGASDYDVGEFLQVLVQRCQDVMDVTTCGVLVEDPQGTLRLAAATSREMHQLEQAEIHLEDGPCFEAHRRVEPVVSHALREERQRWPQVADQALGTGLLAAYGFPLRLRGDCIGALTLYRHQTGAFDDEDVRLAQAFADVAAIGILQERKVARAEQRAKQLQYALDGRTGQGSARRTPRRQPEPGLRRATTPATTTSRSATSATTSSTATPCPPRTTSPTPVAIRGTACRPSIREHPGREPTARYSALSGTAASGAAWIEAPRT